MNHVKFLFLSSIRFVSTPITRAFQGHGEYQDQRRRPPEEAPDERNCERAESRGPTEGVKHWGCRSAAAGSDGEPRSSEELGEIFKTDFCGFAQLGRTQPVSRFRRHALPSALMEVCDPKQSLAFDPARRQLHVPSKIGR